MRLYGAACEIACHASLYDLQISTMEKQASPLREYRKRASLTLADLAAKVGVTVGQLSRIERNGQASLSTALAIQSETGVPVEDIARGEAA
jgi:transcriptional regulator with XRE-family HTH domain